MEEEENSSCDDQIGILLLPEDVLIQILVFLPVLSLLRFKSVCKSWRALIQSSLFIDLHLCNTNNNNFFGTFIYQTSDYENTYRTKKKSEVFMVSSSAAAGEYNEDNNNEFEKLLLKMEDLGFPPRYKVSPPETYTDDIFMVGSCNGLICIHDTKRRDVSLWNPATRQFRLLPKSFLTTLQQPQHINKLPEFVGFGYDVKTNDYKVVLISITRKNSDGDTESRECIFRVQVYSLSRDSWRLLEGINYLPALPRLPLDCNNGVYLNKTGCYYFLGSNYDNDSEPTVVLLSFDFTKEIFTTIQLPHHYTIGTIFLTSFGENQLAVFARMPEKEEYDFKFYDIWVLNEHHGDVNEEEEEEEPSWTKLHSMRIHCTGRNTPRSISNNGEFALVCRVSDRVINGVYECDVGLMQLFNLVTQEVKKEFRTGVVIKAEEYKQSLVSIGGNGTTTDIGAEM